MSPDPTEDRLGQQLRRLADHARTTPRDETPTTASMAHRPRSKRPLVLAGALVLIVLVIGVIAVLRGNATNDGHRVSTSASDGPSSNLGTGAVLKPGAVQRLPVPPGPPVDHVNFFAAGRDLAMLGGDVRRDGHTYVAPGGAIYSGISKQWTKLDLPFSGPPLDASAVWTGTRLIVTGVPCAKAFPSEDTTPFCRDQQVEAWSYSPSDDGWDEIAAPSARDVGPPDTGNPAAPRGIGWTGRYAVFAGEGEDPALLLYDPQADRWSRVSTKTEPRDDTACVTDGGVYSIRQAGGPTVPGNGPTVIATARYQPKTKRWIPLPDHVLPYRQPVVTRVFCSDGEIVAFPGDAVTEPLVPLSVLWFDPSSGAWDELPPVDQPIAAVSPMRVANARVLWFRGYEGDTYTTLVDGSRFWARAQKRIQGDNCAQEYGATIFVSNCSTKRGILRLNPVPAG